MIDYKRRSFAAATTQHPVSPHHLLLYCCNPACTTAAPPPAKPIVAANEDNPFLKPLLSLCIASFIPWFCEHELSLGELPCQLGHPNVTAAATGYD
jgi:hypothetical protein